MDNQNGYMKVWTEMDALEFNRIFINEKEVECLWIENGVFCGDVVKGKDFKVHLRQRHGITSESQMYQCRWLACASRPIQRASLERHMIEQHVPVNWACPYCIHTFTRESSLRGHIERIHRNTST